MSHEELLQKYESTQSFHIADIKLEVLLLK